MEVGKSLESDHRLGDNQFNQNPLSMNPNNPIYYSRPNSNLPTSEPIVGGSMFFGLNYELSPVKIAIFILFSLIPIIWVGVLMGGCSASYRSNQICQAGYFYDYYYQYYYGISYRVSESECCDPFKIVFGVYLGTYLLYLLVNFMVLVVRPPSMNEYFIAILLYSRTGLGSLCCPNSCLAFVYFLFWPIISVLAVVSGIVYLVVLCFEKMNLR